MSHKIAKAQRKAERHVATPNDMHLLIIESNRQRRRADAHKLKVVGKPHSRSAATKVKGKVRQAKDLLRRGPLIVERPIRALWRGMFKKGRCGAGRVRSAATSAGRRPRWTRLRNDCARRDHLHQKPGGADQQGVSRPAIRSPSPRSPSG
jgi:hypothetical protein